MKTALIGMSGCLVKGSAFIAIVEAMLLVGWCESVPNSSIYVSSKNGNYEAVKQHLDVDTMTREKETLRGDVCCMEFYEC